MKSDSHRILVIGGALLAALVACSILLKLWRISRIEPVGETREPSLNLPPLKDPLLRSVQAYQQKHYT